MFYLTTHSTHFIYGYSTSDIWLRTILTVTKETCCHHIGYSFRLAARVLLYAPSHRQDSTHHGICYTSRGALAGTRNIIIMMMMIIIIIIIHVFFYFNKHLYQFDFETTFMNHSVYSIKSEHQNSYTSPKSYLSTRQSQYWSISFMYTSNVSTSVN